MIWIIAIIGVLFIVLKPWKVVSIKNKVKPTITFKDSDIILNSSQGDGTTEFFTDGNLGKNIDIKINWKNGAGFKQSKVNAVIVKRKVGTKYLNVSDSSTPTEMKLTDKKYFEDFSSNDVAILGKFLANDQDVVGDNVIEISYTTTDDSTAKPLGTNTVKITQNHLDTTIDLKTVEVISIPPTSGGVVAELDLKEFTTYNITSHSRKRIISNAVRMEKLADGSVKLKDTNGKRIIIPGTPDNSTYIFKKYLESFYFIQVKGSNQFLTDDRLLHANSLIYKDQKDIFNSAENLDKALFTITPAKLPKARYVWVGKMKDIVGNLDRKTDLMEVIVHDKNGQNIVSKKIPEFKSGFAAYKSLEANFTDDNYSTLGVIAKNGNDSDTEGQQGWIKFDLGQEMEIKSVSLVARTLYESKMEGVGVKLLDTNGQEVIKTSMLTRGDAEKNSFLTFDFGKGVWSTPPNGTGMINFFNKFHNEVKFQNHNNLCGYYTWESSKKIACDIPYGKPGYDMNNLNWELRKDFHSVVKDVADSEFLILRGDKICGVTNVEDEVNCTSTNKMGWETFDITEHEHFPGYHKMQTKRGPDNAKHHCYMNDNGIISCSNKSDATGSVKDAPPLTDSRTAFKFGDVVDLSKGARRKEDNKIYVCADGKTPGCNNDKGQGVGSPNHSVCVNGNYIYCY